jgi:hypothetical protein
VNVSLSKEYIASILRVKVSMARMLMAYIRSMAGIEPRGKRQVAKQSHRDKREDRALSGPWKQRSGRPMLVRMHVNVTTEKATIRHCSATKTSNPCNHLISKNSAS